MYFSLFPRNNIPFIDILISNYFLKLVLELYYYNCASIVKSLTNSCLNLPGNIILKNSFNLISKFSKPFFNYLIFKTPIF